MPVFSIGYSKHGDLFYFLSSRQAKLLRASDKSELPAKVNRIPGFIGINLEHRNGKLLVSRIDKGGPAEQSGALQLGMELVAVGHGTGGKFKNVAGMRLERAIDALKGPFGTVVQLKVIPPRYDRREDRDIASCPPNGDRRRKAFPELRAADVKGQRGVVPSRWTP